MRLIWKAPSRADFASSSIVNIQVQQLYKSFTPSSLQSKVRVSNVLLVLAVTAEAVCPSRTGLRNNHNVLLSTSESEELEAAQL